MMVGSKLNQSPLWWKTQTLTSEIIINNIMEKHSQQHPDTVASEHTEISALYVEHIVIKKKNRSGHYGRHSIIATRRQTR